MAKQRAAHLHFGGALVLVEGVLEHGACDAELRERAPHVEVVRAPRPAGATGYRAEGAEATPEVRTVRCVLRARFDL